MTTITDFTARHTTHIMIIIGTIPIAIRAGVGMTRGTMAGTTLGILFHGIHLTTIAIRAGDGMTRGIMAGEADIIRATGW